MEERIFASPLPYQTQRVALKKNKKTRTEIKYGGARVCTASNPIHKKKTHPKKQNRQALVEIPYAPPLPSPTIGWRTTRPALGSGNLLPVCVPAWLPIARVSWGSAGAWLDVGRLGSRCLIDMDYAYCPSKCCGVRAWARPHGRFAG